MTLTDRYVADALRHLPARQHDDIGRELRALIADGVDARVEQGEDAPAAERAVLTLLGAPAALAASYSERPRHLIGPGVYGDWARVLSLLLATVVPLWLLITGVTGVAAGATAADAIGSALVGALELGVVIAVVVTVVFALVERVPGQRRASAAFDPTMLPPVADARGKRLELIGGVTFAVLVAGALVGLHAVAPVGPIESGLWASGALDVAVLYAVVSIALHLFTAYAGFSLPTAVATTVLGVVFVVPVVGLAVSGRLLEPAFFGEGVGSASTAVAIVVIVLAALDSLDAWVRVARRTRVPR